MLSTGCRGLDALLGGLEPPLLLEVAGPPVSGKTQFCHQLAVMVQLPPEKGGFSGRALYIDTEGTFRPERIISMAEYRGLNPEEALRSVLVAEVGSQMELVEVVLSLDRFKVELVVIDSLAYPFLAPRSVGEARRSWGRMVSILKRLALWGGLAVVSNVVRDGRVVGDPYVAMWVDRRLLLKPLGGGFVEASLALPRGSSCRLRLAEEGVLDA